MIDADKEADRLVDLLIKSDPDLVKARQQTEEYYSMCPEERPPSFVDEAIGVFKSKMNKNEPPQPEPPASEKGDTE